MQDIISGELVALPAMLNGLSAKERLDVVIKLLPFCLLKVETVNSDYNSPLADVDWTLKKTKPETRQ